MKVCTAKLSCWANVYQASINISGFTFKQKCVMMLTVLSDKQLNIRK